MRLTSQPKHEAHDGPAKTRIGWWALFVPTRWTCAIGWADVKNHELAVIAGVCLAPFLEEGDVAFVNPQRTPQPGELGLVEIRYRRTGSAAAIGRDFAATVTRVAIKQIQAGTDGQLFACCNEGSLPVDARALRGTVIGVRRRPSWRRWRSINAPIREMGFALAPKVSRG